MGTSKQDRSGGATDHDIGRRIRKAREFVGLTQPALADVLGVSFQQVQKYESGANRISAGRLQLAAAALGVKVTFFLEGRIHPGDLLRNCEIPTFLEEIRLLRSFHAIQDPFIRQRLVSLAEAIVASNVGRSRPRRRE
jgi:transcriptional regulator with XRE-family HTH domain